MTATALLPIALALALSLATGSLGIPHNDAWSHTKIAQVFAQTGEIVLVGWNRAALIGQVLPFAVLGESVVVQHLFVAALGFLGLLAAYDIVARRAGRQAGLLTVLAIGFTAEFGLLATSFMTDVPAFAAIIGAVALLDRARERQSTAWLAGAVGVALWGSTVREQAVAALVTCAAVAIAALRGRSRVIGTAVALLGFLAYLGFQAWRRALPNGDAPLLAFDPALLLKSAGLAAFTIGLVLLPVAVLVARPASWDRRARLAAWASGAFGAAVALLRGGDVLFGNYLTATGAYSTVLFEYRSVLPTWVIPALAALACLGIALIAGHLVSRGACIDLVAGTAFVLVGAFSLGPAVLGQELFGRALLPILPLAAALLASRGEPRHLSLPLASMAPLALVSILITANALAFDAARWQIAERYVAAGWDARAIDAGLEWNGTHADATFRLDWRTTPCPFGTASHPALRLRSVPERDAVAVVEEARYRTFALVGTSTLIVQEPRCTSANGSSP